MTPKPLCFVIGPFGDPDSKERIWSDFVHTNIIQLAIGDKYDVIRTIDRPEIGDIGDRISRDLEKAEMVIADTSDNNANVFYELGLRHGRSLPCVLIRRADPECAIPFNLAMHEVLMINADYSERLGRYLVAEPAGVIAALRGQVEQAKRMKRIPTFLKEGFYRVRVFTWTTSYAPAIATDWLKEQPAPVRRAIEDYENGVASTLEQEQRMFLAEYLSLKGAASKVWDGDLIYFVNAVTHEMAVGYAAYQFPTGPLIITLTGRENNGVAEVTFDQPERDVSVGDLQVRLPRYKFTVAFRRTGDGPELRGTILHPKSKTVVGDAMLTPKWGFGSDLVADEEPPTMR